MKIAVLGTGMVGQTISGKLAELGHEVIVGTRDVAKTAAQTAPNPFGFPAFSVWQKTYSSVMLASFAEAAQHGDVILNATNGVGSLEAFRLAGEANLNGKIVMDISNPLDFSHGMPPSLFVSNTDSLGEQLQRAFPQAKVVKTLNTVTASVMINPRAVAAGDHTMFVCGNDADAKAQVAAWLQSWFGWQDVLDLGDITSARAMEMYLPIWLRLWGALGTNLFNVKVTR